MDLSEAVIGGWYGGGCGWEDEKEFAGERACKLFGVRLLGHLRLTGEMGVGGSRELECTGGFCDGIQSMKHQDSWWR